MYKLISTGQLHYLSFRIERQSHATGRALWNADVINNSFQLAVPITKTLLAPVLFC